MRLRKVSREAKKEFNSLFPKSRSRKYLHQIPDYSDGGIYYNNSMLEHGLINTSKVAQTITLLEGKMNNQHFQSSYQIYNGERNQLMIEKSMSNINEGVELSTGRQEEDEGINYLF